MKKDLDASANAAKKNLATIIFTINRYSPDKNKKNGDEPVFFNTSFCNLTIKLLNEN
jgi:hypothetical protein